MTGATPPAGDRSQVHASVGPLVEEAALLLGAVEDQLQAWQSEQARPQDRPAGADAGPGPVPAGSAARACPECGAVPGAACTGCPVCRLLAAVRGEHPEVTARVVDGALTVIRALRTLLPAEASAPSPAAESGSRPGAGQSGPAPADASASPETRVPGERPARPTGVQRIDIT